jgi:glutamate 5-kinase
LHNIAVIKIGTSVLSNNGKLDKEVLKGIVDEITQVKNMGYPVVLVTSGAILTGIEALGINKKPSALSLREKQVSAAVGQPLLMKEYVDLFAERGIKVAQILVTEEDFSIKSCFNNFIRTTRALIQNGIIPIINENDAISVKELVNVLNVSNLVRFGDNDRLSAIISSNLKASRLVIMTDVDGVLDEKGMIIEKLRSNEIESLIKKLRGMSEYGRGGIRSKLEAALLATSNGVIVNIINGKKRGLLIQVFEGKEAGTVITP